MPSLMNGLSALGAGVAQFAGTAGIEAQRAALAQQTAVLADQLATTRESAGRQEAGAIAATAADKDQGFRSQMQGSAQDFQAAQQGRSLAAQASEGALSRSAELARAQMSRSTELTRAQMMLDADSPEIKSARQFSKLSPDEKKSYRDEMMTKAGLPSWMTGDDQAGGAVPSAPQADAAAAAPIVTGDAAPAGNVSATPSRPGLNDKALANLPGAAQSLVKGMVDGRISPPSSFAASKPYWQNLIQMATTYDPTFDETTWSGRVATKKDFASGQSAKGVTAINTALSHAGTLLEDFDKLNNGSLPVANWALNHVESAFGDARQGKAEQTVNALASEARKVFAASGGGNLTELQEWQKSFPLNGSPSQQKAALTGFVELLDGRLQSLSDQYNRGMGRTDDPVNMLQPKARSVYEKLTGHEPTNAIGYQTGKAPTVDAPSTPAPAPPAPVAAIPSWVKPGDQYSPSRGQARGADGTVYGGPQ